MPRRFLLFIFLCLLMTSSLTHGDQSIPYELKGIGIDDKTGSKIDLNLGFKDESGQNVQLKDYFNKGKPVLLALVYFGCPNLCTLVLNSTIDTLKDVSLVPGKDFEILAISFDPRETSALAAEKKRAYLKAAGHEGGWHFLVGDQPAVAALTSQMGFKYRWDKDQKQFAHASAVFVLTPQGQQSRIFYGVMYPPRDMKLALLEAGEGKIGTIGDKILLFCYHYDAANKKYSIMAINIMRIGGVLTLAILGIFMAIFWLKEIKKTTPKEANNVV